MRLPLRATGDAVPRRTVRVLTIVAIVLLAVLNGGDVLTTHLVTARGAVEANPLANVLLEGGTLGWVKLALVASALVVAFRIPPRVGVLLLAWFAAGVYATAVLSNLLLLRLT